MNTAVATLARRIAPPLIGLAALAACVELAPVLVLINETPSLPKGLYVRTTKAPVVGAIVALPPPASARPYLAGLGAPDGMRLIKRVAAAEGDRVCVSRARLQTLGRSDPILTRDRRGAPLPAWRGCRRLGAGELIVLGDTAGSFDSRYFGPVRRSAIDGVFMEVLRW